MTEPTAPASVLETVDDESENSVRDGAVSDYLRRAAGKMRRHARAAMTGDGPSLSARWFHEPDGTRHDVIAEDEGSFIAQRIDRATAVHISSWGPAAALAAADVLDGAAGSDDQRFRQLAYTLALTYVGDI